MEGKKYSLWLRYLAVLPAVALALLVKRALGPTILPGPLLTFYGSVLLVSWFCGLGPGLVTVLVAAAITSYRPSISSFSPAPSVGMLAAREILFVIVASVLSWVTTFVRRLQQDLEISVGERTAELSQANEQLRQEMGQRAQAEERFRSAFEHAPIGISLVGLDGRPLRVNRALYQMLGYSEEEFLARPVWEVTHPDDMLVTIEQLRRLVCGEIDRWELEKRFFHKDGRTVWAFSTSSLVRDGEGNPLYVVSQVQDITARKAAEAQLMLQARVLESMGEGVNLTDTTGIIQFANPALEALFGYEPGELIGQHVSVLNALPAEENAHFMATIVEALRTQGTFGGEFKNRRKNGTEFITSARIAAVDISGRSYWLTLQHDITDRHRAETALLQERNFVSAVVDTVGALVGVVDRAGRIVRFNRACEEALGYRSAEVIGRYFWDLLPVPDEIGPAQTIFERLLAGQWPQAYETYWFRRDGTPCLLTWSTSFLRDEHGEVQYVIGSGIDITARKQAEAALRASEERFQHAFQSAPIGMTLVGLDGLPIQVNSAMSDILGYSQVELLSTPVRVVTHPEDMPQANRDRDRLVAGEVRSYRAERRYFHKLGHIVWAELNVSLVRAPDGTPLYLVSQLQDITARKHAEDALRESEERFQTAFQHAPIGIALVTVDGHFMQVNRALCEILGYTEAELLATPVGELLHADDRAAAAADGERVMAGEIQIHTAERRYVHKAGHIIPAQISVSRVRDAHNAAYFIVQLQDITARKHAEDVLRRAHDELELRVAQRTAELEQANLRLHAEIVQRQAVEEKIRRERDFSQRLINSSIDGILAVDRQCRYTVWNPGMARIIGFDAEEVLGRNAFEVFPFLYEIGQQQIFDEVMTGHAVTASVRPYMRPKTGERGFFEGHYSPLITDSGETVGALAIVRDVTEREQVGQRLREAETKYRNLLESMIEGFFAVDNDLRFTYVNRRGEEIVQRPREELIGKNAWEAFPQAIGSVFHRQIEQIKAANAPVEIEFYYPPAHRWFSIHMYRTPDGLAALFEDITERHTREMSAVSDILRALNADIEVAGAFPSIAAGLQLLANCERSALALFDHDAQFVTVVALDRSGGDTAPGAPIAAAEFPGVATVLVGKPYVVRDFAEERPSPLVRRILDVGFRSAVGLPLHGTAGVLGMLIMAWRQRGAAATIQLALLGQIADAVALAVEKSRLFEEVRASRERLQALSRRLLEVQEAERRHIARELHDEVGQHLTALKFLLDSFERLPPDGLAGRLREAHGLIEDLVAHVRDLSLDLRRAMLDDLGLLPSLLWLFDRYTAQTEVRVNFEHQGLDRRLPQEVETAAYRIVQEALTNVARYAQVTEVRVRARVERDRLSLEVLDRGCGFDSEHVLARGVSNGVAGMRERALLLGGFVTVDSAAGAGTRLLAELPLGDAQPQVLASRLPA